MVERTSAKVGGKFIPLRHRRSCSQNFRRECSSERARNVPNTQAKLAISIRGGSAVSNPVAVHGSTCSYVVSRQHEILDSCMHLVESSLLSAIRR